MSEALVIDVGTQAIQVALIIALPLLLVSLLVGLMISLLQVATSLQDVTLTFVPKILAVGLTLVFAGHWMLRNLMTFAHQMFTDLGRVIG
jgi:flagellar biosynthetic protein FliQ